MSNTELVKSILAAFESGDTKKAESLLSEDMAFAGKCTSAALTANH